MNTLLIADAMHGVHLDMDAEKYRGLGGVSASMLRAYWRTTPAHAREKLKGIDETPAMIRGTVAHHFLLEPSKGLRGVAVLPDTYPGEDAKGNPVRKDWNGNANYCKAYIADAKAAGLSPIKSDEYLRAIGCAQAVLSSEAGAYYRDGWGEVSAVVHNAENDVSVRTRFDWIPRRHKIITDLKVTADASPEGFERTLWEHGYHIQAAVYLDAWHALNGSDDPREEFDFIAVEPMPPHAVKVHRLSKTMIALGRIHAAELLELHCRCVRENHWPAYPPTVNVIEAREYQLNTAATKGGF